MSIILIHLLKTPTNKCKKNTMYNILIHMIAINKAQEPAIGFIYLSYRLETVGNSLLAAFV